MIKEPTGKLFENDLLIIPTRTNKKALYINTPTRKNVYRSKKNNIL